MKPFEFLYALEQPRRCVISLTVQIDLLVLFLFVCIRYLVNPDQSLQVHYVTLQDAGRYTCTAVNDVGETKASAQLFVEGINLSIIFILLRKMTREI